MNGFEVEDQTENDLGEYEVIGLNLPIDRAWQVLRKHKGKEFDKEVIVQLQQKPKIADLESSAQWTTESGVEIGFLNDSRGGNWYMLRGFAPGYDGKKTKPTDISGNFWNTVPPGSTTIHFHPQDTGEPKVSYLDASFFRRDSKNMIGNTQGIINIQIPQDIDKDQARAIAWGTTPEKQQEKYAELGVDCDYYSFGGEEIEIFWDNV